MMCIMVRECSHHINVCLIKVWTGVTGNRPLDRVPDGEVVDLEGLYSSMYCFGQKSHEATGLVNFAKRIREWIRKGKAQLHRDEAIGSKFMLVLMEPMYNKTTNAVISQKGSFTIDLNKQSSRCSCMKSEGKSRERDQQKHWCCHRVTIIPSNPNPNANPNPNPNLSPNLRVTGEMWKSNEG